jgi:hypothetical protein
MSDDYKSELRESAWKVQRDEPGAVEEQLREGDKQAEAVEASRDKQDRDYDPNNPAEEEIERHNRGE